MAVDIYMSITDESGVVLVGESEQMIKNPYTNATVKNPVELSSVEGMTEIPLNISSQTSGIGAGKIVFDPITITRPVDRLSQTFFLFHASGSPFKYVDLMFVKPSGAGGSLKPFLSYRLGLVGISQIHSTSDGDVGMIEEVQFQFGQLQIGYQRQNPDGSFTTFAPVGWDRVKNVRI